MAHFCINTLFGDSAGKENLATMADLSNSSDMIALEGLPEDLRKGIDINMHTHCYRVMEQGVIMMKMFAINEYRMFDLPKHSKSTARFITDLLSFVDELINKKKSVDPIPVTEKSVVEKPTNNPCKDLSPCDVVGQDTIRLFQGSGFAGTNMLYPGRSLLQYFLPIPSIHCCAILLYPGEWSGYASLLHSNSNQIRPAYVPNCA